MICEKNKIVYISLFEVSNYHYMRMYMYITYVSMVDFCIHSFSFKVNYCLIAYRLRILLMSVSETLFKHTKISNYSLKKLNILIFNVINTHIFIYTYHLRSLISAPSISLRLIKLILQMSLYS